MPRSDHTPAPKDKPKAAVSTAKTNKPHAPGDAEKKPQPEADPGDAATEHATPVDAENKSQPEARAKPEKKDKAHLLNLALCLHICVCV
jgi:hypothetical protein